MLAKSDFEKIVAILDGIVDILSVGFCGRLRGGNRRLNGGRIRNRLFLIGFISDDRRFRRGLSLLHRIGFLFRNLLVGRGRSGLLFNLGSGNLKLLTDTDHILGKTVQFLKLTNGKTRGDGNTAERITVLYDIILGRAGICLGGSGFFFHGGGGRSLFRRLGRDRSGGNSLLTDVYLSGKPDLLTKTDNVILNLNPSKVRAHA